ncbi:FAD-dependent oxidoreductase [Nocardioides zeae]|uniref:FAD-dependent oxidoreductase n=1 Tax=Nocardioides zeae TaxID=1457234 RepID=A0A6P0HJR6_9ACTN|nr:FAD-dependent oxidoreductase [Nocardioides zeae]
MSEEHLVVVGASLAGARAVQGARDAGFTGRVTLVGEEPHAPYDRPPLTKAALVDDPEPPPAWHLPDAAECPVDLRLGTRATGLDPVARVLATDSGDLPYDALVVATGARPRRLGVLDAPGVADHVHVVRTLEDARRLRSALVPGARVVVVGAGFVGGEVASAAVARGASVTVLEAGPTPLARVLGPPLAAIVVGLHPLHGVDLRCGTSVVAATAAGAAGADGPGVVLDLSDGSRLAADVVVVGIGADPATDWLAGSGLEVSDGVRCDATLRAAPGVHAAGDVARWTNAWDGAEQRIEQWTAAGDQGEVAGRNAVLGLRGDAGEECAVVPYFWSVWHGHRIQFAGALHGGVDEVAVLDGDPWGAPADGWAVVVRSADRVGAVLAVDRPGVLVRQRRHVAARAGWDEVLGARRAG